jgi:Uma2 family endonuclease
MLASAPATSEEMMGELQFKRMTPEEFLGWQEQQDRLYELIDGAPILSPKMMTGASQAHDRIVVNIIAALHGQLRGKPCRPTTDDLAVRIPSGNIRRPDITIECGQAGPRELLVSEPRAVFEVLSPSTMSFDRFRKVREYQTVDTLSYILLVDTEAARIDLISRGNDGAWLQSQHDGLDAVIHLIGVGASLRLADVYEGVPFEKLVGPSVQGG